MECEFSVELGSDDPTLAVPWRSPDGSIAYVDLRAYPDAICDLPEVHSFPELREILLALNTGESATAKCDVWFDTLMDVDDEPYQAKMKCASYVDVFFVASPLRFGGFEVHEPVARQFVQRVRKADDLQARAELVVRRVYYGEDTQHAGLYWTLYATGYGADTASARQELAKALKILGNSLQRTK